MKETNTKIIFSKNTNEDELKRAISYLKRKVNGTITVNGRVVKVKSSDASCLSTLMKLKLHKMPDIEYISKRAGVKYACYCCELKTIKEQPQIELNRFKSLTIEASFISDWVNEECEEEKEF